MDHRQSVFSLSLLVLLVSSFHVNAIEIIANDQLSLYGRLSLDSYWGRDGDESHLGLSSNSTYVGFKGSLPLEQGFTAYWQLEQEINLDEGGSTWASRNNFIALANDKIELKVGQFDTPYKKVLSPIGYFDATFADLRSVVGASAVSVLSNINHRAKNSIQTTWKATNDLKFVGAYSSDLVGGAVADDNDRDLSSLAGYWKHRNFWLGAAWQTQEILGVSGARVVVKIDLDTVTLGGFMEVTNSDDVAGHEHHALGGNVKYPWINNTYLVGQLVIVDDDDSIRNSSAIQFSGGAFHNMGKNFKVYGTFSFLDNDQQGQYGLGFERSDLLLAAGPGEDLFALAVGFLVEI